MANNWQVIQTAPFIGGLNTEVNDLQDATQYTSDELNMVIKNNGTRARRLGVDYEEGYKMSLNTLVQYIDGVKITPAFSAAEWLCTADNTHTYYIVIQEGPKILFYRNEGTPFSAHQEEYEIDLASYKISEDLDNYDYAETPVSFTTAYGGLFIVSKAIYPILVTKLEPTEGYDPDPIPAKAVLDMTAGWNNKAFREYQSEKRFKINGHTIGTSQIVGRATEWLFDTQNPYGYGRDDFGVPVTESGEWWDSYTGAFGLIYMRTARYYERWWNSLDPSLRRGITASAITPYAGEYVTSGEAAIYGGYAQEYLEFTCPVGPLYSGLTISVETRARSNKLTKRYVIAYTKEAVTGGFIPTNIKSRLDIKIRDFKGIKDIYDGRIDLLLGEGVSIRPQWPRSEFDMTDEQITESRAHTYNLWNQGWNQQEIEDYLDAYTYTEDDIQMAFYPANNYQWFLAKDSSTLAFKPTDLIKIAFGNTRAPSGRSILYYLEQDRATVSGIEGIEVEYPRTPYYTDIIAYAGRVWYLSGDTVLYSQVLLDDLSKADKCYQEADPTSEKISDLVDTDGGMIQIPELGEGIRFCLVGAALAVVGTKSIQLISGGQNNAFTATAYTRGAMQAYTTISPRSFVTTEYGTFFWSDVGIVLLSYQEGYQAQNITENTINTFYQKIPDWAMKKCVGVYNRAQKQIVWMYPSDEDTQISLNKLLIYDILKNSWTPFEVASSGSLEDGTSLPWIVGGVTLETSYKNDNIYPVYAEDAEIVDENGFRILADDPIEREDQTFKSAVLVCFDNFESKTTFANFDNLNCLDWSAGDIYGPGVNYNSYLVSHPINLNSTAYNKTIPYLLTYFRRTETGYTLDGQKIYPSACQGAIQWDWNNSGKAGKWDAQQELYRYDRYFNSYEVVDNGDAVVDDEGARVIIVDPVEQGDLLTNDYVFSKTRVYGGGRAFKVKLSSKDNNYFIVENVGFNIYGDARI